MPLYRTGVHGYQISMGQNILHRRGHIFIGFAFGDVSRFVEQIGLHQSACPPDICRSRDVLGKREAFVYTFLPYEIG